MFLTVFWYIHYRFLLFTVKLIIFWKLLFSLGHTPPHFRQKRRYAAVLAGQTAYHFHTLIFHNYTVSYLTNANSWAFLIRRISLSSISATLLAITWWVQRLGQGSAAASILSSSIWWLTPKVAIIRTPFRQLCALSDYSTKFPLNLSIPSFHGKNSLIRKAVHTEARRLNFI